MAMQIYLDGQSLPGAADTLSAALDAASAASSGRLIVSIRADGFEVPATDLEAPPERVPYASRLEFITTTPGEAVRSVLHDAAGALSDLGANHARAASEIQGGNLEDALVTLGQILQTWSQVRAAMELASRSADMGVYDLPVSQGDLSQVLTGLVDRLTEVKRSLGAADWSGLADVLAYDMEEQAQRCRGWLTRASSRTAGSAA